MYLCQEDCVENYHRLFDQHTLEKKCQQCLLVISEIVDKCYCWQTKHFCSVDCLGENSLFIKLSLLHNNFLFYF